MNTATRRHDIDLSGTRSPYVVDAGIYELSQPVAYRDGSKRGETRFLRVSAANTPDAGPETFIFPADETGNVIDWGELKGSYRGGYDHERALNDAGIQITEDSR